MEYTAQFHRSEGWSQCNGIRHEIKGRGRELVYPLCRLMVENGLEDGPVTFFDERGMKCMSIKSFHAGAKLCLTETGDTGFHVVKWVPFEERGNFGNTGPVVISEAWYNALHTIISGGKTALDGLHGHTRNAFLARNYVSEAGEVTEEGLNAMAEYENAPKAETTETSGETEEATEEKHPGTSDDIDLPRLLSVKQREALEIAYSGSDVKWVLLHGKTANFVIRSGWVQMHGSRPALTDLGLQVAKAFEIVNDAA